MNHKARYTCIGTLFGCNFVAAAWAIDLVASGLMPTIANIVQLHLNNPVIYIVDMAPFVLGFTFYYLGTVHAHLDAKAKSQHDSDTRFRALMNSSFDAIIIINTQGAIVDFNAAAEELFGYQKQQIVGDDLANIVIPLRYREAHGQGLKVFLETGVGPLIGQRVEIEALHHDGHEFPVEIAIEKYDTVTGTETDAAFVGFIRDISQRKDAAAKLIQSSKLATLGEMATSVAHELNQPLSVIRMAAGNIRQRLSKGIVDPKYLSEKLLRIEEQTARAATIIDHMRMFGREAKEPAESIDPRNAVKRALDLMGEQLRLAGIEVVTVLPENCACVLGHVIQVEQVLLNLLTNALDAITQSEGMAKITLQVFEEGNVIHITTQDTGGGIPDDVLQRIFEPFFTTKSMERGTGLGLSVSYGIIQDMKGTIAAENIDDGARFTITLPIIS
ncbi:MAG: PAS domain S-box-containing protein [Candidatus Azotimanducaceae bacterium]|jgi:PAS domain S-box-containing protein